MSKRIAKKGDLIVGLCNHLCLAGAPTPAPMQLPFRAPIESVLAPTVRANGKAVAVRGSEGRNEPRHVPQPVGHMPEHAILLSGRSVFAERRSVAAHGDAAVSCDEHGERAHVVVGDCTVLVGE